MVATGSPKAMRRVQRARLWAMTRTASQGRGHRGHQLVAGVGQARGVAQVEVPVNHFTQTQAEGQGGGQQQPSIGYQAVIIKGDMDAIGVLGGGSIQRVLPLWERFPDQKPLSQIRESTFSRFQDTFNPHSFGGFGIGRICSTYQASHTTPSSSPSRADGTIAFGNPSPLPLVPCTRSSPAASASSQDPYT